MTVGKKDGTAICCIVFGHSVVVRQINVFLIMVERYINENLEEFRSFRSLDLDSRLEADTVHHADSYIEA